MDRLQFMGSTLFIPIFLVSVGVLLEPKVMVDPEDAGDRARLHRGRAGRQGAGGRHRGADLPLHLARGRRHVRPVRLAGGGDAGDHAGRREAGSVRQADHQRRAGRHPGVAGRHAGDGELLRQAGDRRERGGGGAGKDRARSRVGRVDAPRARARGEAGDERRRHRPGGELRAHGVIAGRAGRAARASRPRRRSGWPRKGSNRARCFASPRPFPRVCSRRSSARRRRCSSTNGTRATGSSRTASSPKRWRGRRCRPSSRTATSPTSSGSSS